MGRRAGFPKSSILFAGVIVIALLAPLCISKGNSLLAIDLGADSFKVALLIDDRKPPFQVVINEQSKRKTSTLIAFHDGQCLVGDNAKHLITRVPQKVFQSPHHLLGFSNKSVIQTTREDRIKSSSYHDLRNFLLRFPSKERVALFDEDSNQIWNPEELVALLLDYSRHIASEAAGYPKSKIQNIVMTVPPFFTYQQRQSLRTAASLVDLNVLAILNDYTAVTYNYAVDRTFDKEDPKRVLFFDLGASSARASVVAFQELNSKMLHRGSGQVLATAWDHQLSGRELDRRLAQHFAVIVEEQMRKTSGLSDRLEEIRTNPKVYEKLLKEAKRVKEMLSANSHTIAAIENLIGDFDFNVDITRAQFEHLSMPIFERIRELSSSAIQSSQLTVSDIDEVEIVGGLSRIPRLRTLLEEILSLELGSRINSDEGNLVGSIYYGLQLLEREKTPSRFDLTDIPAVASFEIESEDGKVGLISQNQWFFGLQDGHPTFSSFPSLVIPASKDSISLRMRYHQTEYGRLLPGISRDLGTLAIKGLAEARAQYNLGDAADSNLLIQFKIERDVFKVETVKIGQVQGEAFQLLDEESFKTADFYPIPFTFEDGSSSFALTSEEVRLAQQKLARIKESENLRKGRDEAKNNLESFIFEVKEKMQAVKGDKSTLVNTADLEKEIERAEGLLSTDVDTQQYTKALHSLTAASKRAFSKYEQYQDLQKAIEESRDYIAKLRKRIASDQTQKKLSPQEAQEVSAVVDELESWLSQKEKQLTSADEVDRGKHAQEIRDQTKKAQQKYRELTAPKKSGSAAQDPFWMKVKVVLLVVGFVAVLGAGLYVWQINNPDAWSSSRRKNRPKRS